MLTSPMKRQCLQQKVQKYAAANLHPGTIQTQRNGMSLIAKVLNHQPDAFSDSQTMQAYSESFFSQIVCYNKIINICPQYLLPYNGNLEIGSQTHMHHQVVWGT